MKKIYFFLYIITVVSQVNAQKTNPDPSKLVTDEYDGVKVVDEYRNLRSCYDQLDEISDRLCQYSINFNT